MNTRLFFTSLAPALMALAVITFVTASFAGTSLTLHPLYDKEDNQTGIAVPFIKKTHDENSEKKEYYLKPLLYRVREGASSTIWFLWPFVRYSSSGVSGRTFAVNPFLKYSSGGGDAASFSILPILMIKREDPKTTMLFPVYGRLRRFLGFQDAFFCLFPVYGSQKRNGIQSRYLLWPIAAVHKKEGRTIGGRIAPLYGSYDDGNLRKKFILWPFYTTASTRDNTGEGTYCFPFYGRFENKELEQKSALWPFFYSERYKDGTKTKVNKPWPLWMKYGGTQQSGWESWPLCARYSKRGTDTSYVLWPLRVKKVRREGSSTITSGHTLFWHSRNVSDQNGARVSCTKTLWPLFRINKEKGVKEFSCLRLFWFTPPAFVEELFTPVHKLIYVKRAEEEKEYSLIGGIFSYKKKGPKKELKLPFVKIRWQ